jgi:8-amino-7-oxononanoate synthase
MNWLDDELGSLKRSELYRIRRRIQSGAGAVIRHRGRDLINFSSNDYLNLAGDPRLGRAAARAARRWGTGAAASPLVSGWLTPLRLLERDLAGWQLTDAALVFSSGFAANLAVVAALADRDSVIFSDQLNHASLIDGCRLSRARVVVYRHADVDYLEALLRKETARRRLIVSETVFSMDGDFAPVASLLNVARKYKSLLVLDEAHALGVFGPEGRGLVPLELALPASVVRIGTLSKSLGAQGGFICGSNSVIDWLVNRARPYLFSTALAPPIAAAARRGLNIITADEPARRYLLDLAEQLRTGLQHLGLPATNSRSQIVPIVVGDASAAVELSMRLEDDGLLVPGIRPPSVPEGTSRLRISLTAGHTGEDVQRLLDALKRHHVMRVASIQGSRTSQ